MRRFAALAAAGAVAAQLSGCADSMPFSQLPDLSTLRQKVMGKEEQQQKINEMIENGNTHQREAAKEIEKGR